MKARLQPVLFLAAARFLKCFMSTFLRPPFSTSFSFLSLNPHPLNRVLFLPYELEIESKLDVQFFWNVKFFRVRLHARQWSFTGRRACVDLFSFQFNLYSFFCWVGGGARSRNFPKECCPFFPKTTVSWPFIDKLAHEHRLLSTAWCCCTKVHTKIYSPRLRQIF